MGRKISYFFMKLQGLVGLVVSIILVIVGFKLLIPASAFAGLVWTLVALVCLFQNSRMVFGRRSPAHRTRTRDKKDGTPESWAERRTRARLEKLESLRNAGAISENEYYVRRKDLRRRH